MTARLLLFLGFAAAAAATPAAAPAQVRDRIVDIYGDDRCPANNGQEIVVCRRHPEGERFRIPRELRESEPAPQALGGNAVAAVNSTGGNAMQVQSCNAIGGGVNAGCTLQQNRAWKAQQRAEKAERDSIP